MLSDALNFVPLFVLVFFRVCGLMLSAPVFGSTRIPRRVKVLFALVTAAGLVNGVKVPPAMPATTGELAIGIGGELLFGMVMGLGVGLTFIAVSWAGEIMGQQMGFNLAESFDPQFGGSGSIVGDLYFMLTLVVFLLIGGHHQLILGVAASFKTLPLLAAAFDANLLNVFLGLVTGSTVLAIKLAAPMLVALLVVDVALGFISKTMPQINVMNTGVTIRSVAGMVILIVGLALATGVISDSLIDGVNTVTRLWKGPAAPLPPTPL